MPLEKVMKDVETGVGENQVMRGGELLVVDDSSAIRVLLANALRAAGYGVRAVNTGEEAIRRVQQDAFDAVVCDLRIKDIDGFKVLARVREIDPTLPVIVLSESQDAALILRAVRDGAFDCVNKAGADRRHLMTSIERAVAHGRLLRENIRLNLELEMRITEVDEEKKRSDELLHRLLPHAVAERLKGEIRSFAEHHPSVTVVFADIVGFTGMAADRDPGVVIGLLDEVFSAFDALAEKHGVEKIKTIGDAWMGAAGVPVAQPDHAKRVADLALGMIHAVMPKTVATSGSFNLRIGVHSGPVAAGVIGKKRPIFDLWGATVNLASRLESHGVPGRVQVSDATKKLLESSYDFELRGSIHLKGLGQADTWFLLGPKR